MGTGYDYKEGRRGNVWGDRTVLYPHYGGSYITVYMLKLIKSTQKKKSQFTGCPF